MDDFVDLVDALSHAQSQRYRSVLQRGIRKPLRRGEYSTNWRVIPKEPMPVVIIHETRKALRHLFEKKGRAFVMVFAGRKATMDQLVDVVMKTYEQGHYRQLLIYMGSRAQYASPFER